MSKSNKPRILVTSALPYANGPIHIGHLVEYVQTDIFVRFLRLIDEDVLYVCADDAHGAPIEIKASELKTTPEELVENMYKEHTADFKEFLINFDNYHTTNSPENKHYSDLIFNRLNDKGFIYKKDIEVTYCEHCNRTLPDRYVKGKCPKCSAENQYGDVCESCNAAYKTIELIDPYCTLCKNHPVRKTSTHYFFKLSAFSEKLEEWLNNNKNLQPEIRNFVLNWIKNGLEDWNISRDGPYFGFKIPGEEDKYYYVWLDAPIGYIAATENYCKKHNLKTEDYWNSKDAKIYHFIGKDIIYFHFLFWPAMLMASDFELPYDIVVHGFLTVNNEKMSKSRGTFFTAKDFLKKYNPEYLRFYYAGFLSKTLSDLNLDFNDFRNKVNNELAANIGNFCYRTLSFLNKHFEGEVNELDENTPLKEEITKSIGSVKKNYNALNFNEALKGILYISSLGNKYFQASEPWKLVNTDKEQTHKILGLCVNIVGDLSILLQPIMPNISAELQKQLNLENLKWKDLGFNVKNHKVNKEKILITKMEEEKTTESKKPEFPLNLKIAKILEVKEHPNADKLYVLQIDLGTEKRQLVAGLRSHYTQEELLNKNVVVITNLKYAKLRGVESQGMLLAGGDGEVVGVLTVDKSEAGDKVFIDGLENSAKELTYDDFAKITITVKNHHPVFEGKDLKTGKETIKVEKAVEGSRVK